MSTSSPLPLPLIYIIYANEPSIFCILHLTHILPCQFLALFVALLSSLTTSPSLIIEDCVAIAMDGTTHCGRWTALDWTDYSASSIDLTKCVCRFFVCQINVFYLYVGPIPVSEYRPLQIRRRTSARFCF